MTRYSGFPASGKFIDTKANIEALDLDATGEGAIAYATDTDVLGWYDGAAWRWLYDLDGSSYTLILDADGDTHIAAPTDDQIDFTVSNARQVLITDGKFWPNTDDDIDLGDATHEFKDAYFDGTVQTDLLDVDEYAAIGPGATLNSNILVNAFNDAVDTTGYYFGLNLRADKTAGATDLADAMIGAAVDMRINQVGGEVGNTFGATLTGRLDAGTIGNAIGGARNLFGMYAMADLNGGTVTGSVYGSQTVVDQEAANTIDGNIYGHQFYVDADGTVTGNVYMVYLLEGDGVDYGIYQNGVADNYLNGNVGIGDNTPNARLHVDQASSSGAIPVLALDQADLSEGFIDFLGTSAASATGPISTWTAGNTIQGFVRVEINGAAYWMPYYDAPTS